MVGAPCTFTHLVYVANNYLHHIYLGLKRDPGIPNLYPFKEQLLKQIQERKIKAEAEKQRRKEERQQEQSRLRSLNALQKDAISRTKKFDKVEYSSAVQMLYM